MSDPPPVGRHWQAADGWHVDVRGLAAPEPMVAILAALERVGRADEVIVHHFREPVYLYPELVERGWNWRIVPGTADEVRLILSRKP